MVGIINWLEDEVKRLNVNIIWAQSADTNSVTALKPDLVIIATGGVPDHDYVEGGELSLFNVGCLIR